MNFKCAIRYAAQPARVIMVLVVLIMILALVRLIVQEMVVIPFAIGPRPAPVATEPPSQEERIARAQPLFLPDGTIHLIFTSPPKPNSGNEPEIEVYDVNHHLLWQGPRNKLPYAYLWEYCPIDRSFSAGLGWWENMQRIIAGGRTVTVPVIARQGNRILERWRYEPGEGYF
jgi:hypothetical protein